MKKKKDYLEKLEYAKLEGVKMYLADTTKVKFVMYVLPRTIRPLAMNC